VSNVPAQWSLPTYEDFRKNVHELILVGYQSALSKIKSGKNHQETHITGFIAEAIDDWLQLDEAKGFYGFDIHDDRFERSHDDTRRGRSRLRSDLVVTYNNPVRRRFTFESKRLNKDAGDVYCGKDGMGCFINGLYAPKFPEVAMLGYVETKTIIEWKEILWQHIENKSEELQLFAEQKNIQIIEGFPNEWKSQHRRDIIGEPVTILHILLDCIR
jgi:hypothetical protein